MPETYASRCHEAQGDWMPEVGSKEYQRRWEGMHPTFDPEAVNAFGHAVKCITAKRPVHIPVVRKKVKMGFKYHWSSNKVCTHVVTTDQDRVLDGDKFDAIPRQDRCICCDHWFVNA